MAGVLGLSGMAGTMGVAGMTGGVGVGLWCPLTVVVVIDIVLDLVTKHLFPCISHFVTHGVVVDIPKDAPIPQSDQVDN